MSKRKADTILNLALASLILLFGFSYFMAPDQIKGQTTPTCPCTIFGTAPPVSSGVGGPLEVGVKFTSNTAGFIQGVRFYKSASDTGTHIGNLWTSAGMLLATVPFTGETGSGWQQANFSAPVAIAANTTYVASYFSTGGGFSYTLNGLATAISAPPLQALASGGVYAYANSSTFPASVYQAANYWVDLVFALSNGSVTPTGPFVTSSPATLPLVLSNPGNVTVTVTGTPGQIVMFSVPGGGTIPASGVLPGILGVMVIPAPTTTTIITPSFPPLTQGKPFSYQMLAAGGVAPYTWAVTAGVLPAGLTMSSSGLITGTPTGALGTSYNFTLTATDSAGKTVAMSLGQA